MLPLIRSALIGTRVTLTKGSIVESHQHGHRFQLDTRHRGIVRDVVPAWDDSRRYVVFSASLGTVVTDGSGAIIDGFQS